LSIDFLVRRIPKGYIKAEQHVSTGCQLTNTLAQEIFPPMT